MWETKILGVDLYHVLAWFWLYSFCGWIWESSYVSIRQKNWSTAVLSMVRC